MARAGIFNRDKTGVERCAVTGEFVRFFKLSGQRLGIVEDEKGRLWISPASKIKFITKEPDMSGRIDPDRYGVIYTPDKK